MVRNLCDHRCAAAAAMVGTCNAPRAAWVSHTAVVSHSSQALSRAPRLSCVRVPGVQGAVPAPAQRAAQALPSALLLGSTAPRARPSPPARPQFAAHGFVVAVPEFYHEFLAAGVALTYTPEDTAKGNAFKARVGRSGRARGRARAVGGACAACRSEQPQRGGVASSSARRGSRAPASRCRLHQIEKSLAAYDSDAAAAIAWLQASPHCNGAIGTAGFCIGGALAFRTATHPDVKAACCWCGGCCCAPFSPNHPGTGSPRALQPFAVPLAPEAPARAPCVRGTLTHPAALLRLHVRHDDTPAPRAGTPRTCTRGACPRRATTRWRAWGRCAARCA